jgi:hypothetical protein
MTDPAAPAPPPAAVSAIAREVRWQLSKRTRRAGGRLAARLTPRGRNCRGAPSFNVEAPSEAVPAIAGLGSFGTPFGLVPTLAARRGLRAPENAGAAGRKALPTRPQAVGIPYISARAIHHCQNFQNAFQTPSKHLPGASKRLQKFPKFPGLGDAQGRRDGYATGWAAPVGLVPSPSLPRPLERPELRAARELRAGFLVPATR